MNLGAPEILLLLVLIVLLFGAARLPKLAKSLREARDEFNKESSPASPPPTTPPPADTPLAHETPPQDAPPTNT